MRIVVVGAGKMGYSIAKLLADGQTVLMMLWLLNRKMNAVR